MVKTVHNMEKNNKYMTNSSVSKKGKASTGDVTAIIKKHISLVAILIIALIVAAAFVWSINNVSTTGNTSSTPANSTGTNITSSSSLVGKAAVGFTLEDTENVTISLSDFRGHPVLLEFFAEWCPHCQEQGPILRSLYYNFTNTDFYSVAIPYDENLSAVISYQRDGNYSWFFSLLNMNQTYITTLWKVTVVPTIYLISSSGIVRYAYEGTTSYAVLYAALRYMN